MGESTDIAVRLPKGTPAARAVETLFALCSLTSAGTRRIAENGRPLLACDDTDNEGIRKIIRLGQELRQADAVPEITEFGKP